MAVMKYYEQSNHYKSYRAINRDTIGFRKLRKFGKIKLDNYEKIVEEFADKNRCGLEDAE